MDGSFEVNGVVAGMSCTGKRTNNEDTCSGEKIADGYLIAIADGIGGHSAGEVASALAISLLFREFHARYRKEMSRKEIEQLFIEIFRNAHNEIEDAATGEREGMGTTLVAAFIRGNTAFIANSGDSRAYIIRKGILFRTKDHSVVQSLIDNHQISPEDALSHPFRAMLTHSLGSNFIVDTFCLSLRPDDLVLLSSDGFHDYVAEQDIATLEWDGPLNELVRRLVTEAVEVSRDNVTVVVYRGRA
ncbi:MAG TPA: protein phosphatase 2C domain-containing protein [Methanoregulaceae archaeon]|nr:protein phosphatase 2C domain-containing protein [Methanoregulaceae archaeon]